MGYYSKQQPALGNAYIVGVFSCEKLCYIMLDFDCSTGYVSETQKSIILQ